MSIRWKSLILLLFLSLSPMLVVMLVSQAGTRDMGGAIAGDVAETMTEMVSQELVQTVSDFAKVMESQAKGSRLALAFQIREIEKALFSDNETGLGKIYTAGDFDSPETAPKGLMESVTHVYRTRDGAIKALPISMDHQAFILPPGAKLPEFMPDMMRLERLTPFYRQLNGYLTGSVYWQYVALENGLMASYPGHGNYPANYDPRTRLWFKNVMAKPEIQWAGPYVDASTSQVVAALAGPVRDNDGKVVGVAGMDLLLSRLLQVNSVRSQWTDKLEAFLVEPVVNQGDGTVQLHVIAQRDMGDEIRSWRGIVQDRWIISPNQEEYERFTARLGREDSGYAFMNYNGKASIWAFSKFGGNMVLLAVMPEHEITGPAAKAHDQILKGALQQLQAVAFTSAVVVALVFLFAFKGSRTVTRQLRYLAEGAGRLANGDFETNIPVVNTGDEREQVARAFNEMLPKLRERVKIINDLKVAHKVQASLLPEKAPQLPWLNIAGECVMCDQTGGDYYDYFIEEKTPDKATIAIGDVTGHGVAAALLMATARSFLRAEMLKEKGLGKKVARVNDLLIRDTYASGRFMTLLLLELDRQTGTASWVRAGHDPAIVYDFEKDEFSELMGQGMALGMMDGQDFEVNTYELGASGQIIFLGTDGIWEAHDRDRQMFGKERLLEVIRENRHEDAGTIADKVLARVYEFLDGHVREDDITMVVLKVRGKDNG